MFAAALGWNSLPKPSAKPGRMHRAALGSSVLNSQHWDSKPLSAPGCVHTPVCPSGTQGCPVVSGLTGNSLVLDWAHITSTQAHSTDPLELGTWKEGGAWWGSERRKGRCHPGSFSATSTVSGSVGRGSNRFPYGRVWPQELFLINLKIHPVKHPQLGISKLTFPMSTEFPSPRTQVCHRLSDGFTSWRHFHSGPWIHCLFFYDEAKVNVNNEFLGMLGIISRVEMAAFKDKDWSLIGSLESVSQLQLEQKLPHGKTPGLGRNILEYTETFEETPARDTSSQAAAGPCHDSAFSHSFLFPSTENVIKTWRWLIPSREWFSMLASW